MLLLCCKRKVYLPFSSIFLPPHLWTSNQNRLEYTILEFLFLGPNFLNWSKTGDMPDRLSGCKLKPQLSLFNFQSPAYTSPFTALSSFSILPLHPWISRLQFPSMVNLLFFLSLQSLHPNQISL